MRTCFSQIREHFFAPVVFGDREHSDESDESDSRNDRFRNITLSTSPALSVQ
jgi:hypothetical protein